MPILKIAYIELPTQQIAASKTFYTNLFGWTFQDYGPTYAAFSDSGTGGGLNADPAERTKAPVARNRIGGLGRYRARHPASGRENHTSHLQFSGRSPLPLH
jgi:hypothetical protein